MASSISFSSSAGSIDGKCSPEIARRDAVAFELVVQRLARNAERGERRRNPAFARRQRGANLAFLIIGDAHRQRARGRGLRRGDGDAENRLRSEIAELADVARPIVVSEPKPRRSVDPPVVPAELLRRILCEDGEKRQRIVATLAQRGRTNSRRTEAVKQVCAESPFLV